MHRVWISIASAVAEILTGNPQIWEAPLATDNIHFFFWWELMMGLGKLQLHAKFEVGVWLAFICYGNIREFLKQQIRFLSHPLGELGVTYRLHL